MIRPLVRDNSPGMSRCLSVALPPESTRNFWERAAPTAPIGTFTNNIDLQPNAAVRTPPRIEPAAKPAESTEMKIPRAPFPSLPPGKVATRIANAVTVDMAAPMPWTPLATTRESRVGDRPARSEERRVGKEGRSGGRQGDG